MEKWANFLNDSSLIVQALGEQIPAPKNCSTLALHL